MAKWTLALRAAQRYMKQFPTARINESAVENRQRPVRILGHHVFYIVEAYLKAVTEKIEYSPSNTNVPVADENKFQTGAEIAQYGDGVIAKLNTWWEQATKVDFGAIVPTSYGKQELHEVFERSAWHSAQHARQLMAILERMNALLRDAQAEPTIKAGLEGQGLTVRPVTLDEQKAWVTEDRKNWVEWVRIAKIPRQSL